MDCHPMPDGNINNYDVNINNYDVNINNYDVNINNYEVIKTRKYTVKQLKRIATENSINIHNINMKADLLHAIYYYFSNYKHALKIQNVWRKYLYKKYTYLRGSARINRNLCVNSKDFLSYDDVCHIPMQQFFSFTDDASGKVYGFDIMSIYSILPIIEKKNIKKNIFFREMKSVSVINPYTRTEIPKHSICDFYRLIRIAKIFKDTLVLYTEEDSNPANPANPTNPTNPTNNELTIEQRIINVFETINGMGNYTQSHWFGNLSVVSMHRFIYEILDIWRYRGRFDLSIQLRVCPGLGEYLLYHGPVYYPYNHYIRDYATGLIELLIHSGSDSDARHIGSQIVLSALTLVSEDAANALPWLYESMN